MDQGWSPGPGREEPTPQGARVPEGGAISPEVRPRAALEPRGGELGEYKALVTFSPANQYITFLMFVSV